LGRFGDEVVRSYLAYHAVPTNWKAITPFVHYVTSTGTGRSGAAGKRAK
jgi:hypothetical protein